jgi:hypothetical protein
MMSACGLAFGAKRALYRSNMCRVSRGMQLPDGAATKGRGDLTPTPYWTPGYPPATRFYWGPKKSVAAGKERLHESYTVTVLADPMTP